MMSRLKGLVIGFIATWRLFTASLGGGDTALNRKQLKVPGELLSLCSCWWLLVVALVLVSSNCEGRTFGFFFCG